MKNTIIICLISLSLISLSICSTLSAADQTDSERIQKLETTILNFQKRVIELENWKSITLKDNASTPQLTAESREDGYGIITVEVTNKRLKKQEYKRYLFWDMKHTLVGLDKNTRAIKGVLIITDLFDERQMGISWTINKPLAGGSSVVENDNRLMYNQLKTSQKWMSLTKLKDLRFKFQVKSIIYEDGSTEKFG